MNIALILAAFWVIAAAGVAMLPMRRQIAPGVVLLVAAPVLIGVIWWQQGAWLGGAALFGFVSMFRRPLIYVYRRARGLRDREEIG